MRVTPQRVALLKREETLALGAHRAAPIVESEKGVVLALASAG